LDLVESGCTILCRQGLGEAGHCTNTFAYSVFNSHWVNPLEGEGRPGRNVCVQRSSSFERRLPDLRIHPETFTTSFRGTPPKPVASSVARVKSKASTNQVTAILHVAGR
jgi:hypothetical protein